MKGVNMGRFIAQRRRYLGMTQQELAEKMNISKSAVAVNAAVFCPIVGGVACP